MSVPALIPFKPRNPKTRLSCVLELPEREKFAQMMLCDVVVAAREAGCEPFLLGTEPFFFNGLQVIVDPGELNESINEYLQKNPGPLLLIIMADVALASGALQIGWLRRSRHGHRAEADGGTNAIYLSSADRFRVSYYGMALKNISVAEECRALLRGGGFFSHPY